MKLMKINVNQLRENLPARIDLMICSSSYEERCKTVPDCFSTKDVGLTFIVENSELEMYVKENTDHLVNRFGINYRKISISTNHPLKTADSLIDPIEMISKNSQINNILVDITTFTHESMLILLKLLRIHCSQKNIFFTYASAREYSLGDDLENKWLSRGVESVRTILGFPGDVLPSQKTHLIVLVGYEAKRALKLINSLEPQSLSLGFGKSGSETAEKTKEANQHFLKLVERATISYCDVKRFEIFCNDPLKTKDAILNEIVVEKNQNIIVAPMNNKITTMGTALAAIENPSIQLCYAKPIEYNYRNYSTPGDHCYLIELPELFG